LPLGLVSLLRTFDFMMSQDLLSRITIDPNICHGKPTIRNTRMMVESILEYLAGGDSVDDVLEAFPDLEREVFWQPSDTPIVSFNLKELFSKQRNEIFWWTLNCRPLWP